MEYLLYCVIVLVSLLQVQCADLRGLILMRDERYGGNLLNGTRYRMGDFDECVSELEAKYCYTELHIWPLNHSSLYWQQIQSMNLVKTNFRRDLLHTSVCVTRNTSDSATQGILLQLVTQSADSLGVQVRVQEPRCTTSVSRPWTWQDVVMGLASFLLLATVVAATCCTFFRPTLLDTRDGCSKSALRGLACFSMTNSWRSFTAESRDNADLRIMHGIRAMTVMAIVYLHSWLHVVTNPVAHPERLEKEYSSFTFVLLLNANVMIAAMFVISGFLMTYNFLAYVDVKNGFKIKMLFKSVISRYLRLTPCYAFLVFFTATWLPRIATGPTWFATVDVTHANCQKYWWTNLLYLNNYIGVDDACLVHTWYLAADFQLYVVCLGLMAVISAYPRCGKYVLATGMILGIAIPFTQTFLMEEIEPTLVLTPENMRQLTKGSTYQLSYIASHHNLGPYMIGIISAYYYSHIKRNGIKLRKIVVLVLWVAATQLPMIPLVDVSGIYQTDYRSGRLWAALLNSVNRSIYALGISATILLAATGRGGMFNRLASSALLGRVSRLSYCIYLVHFVVQTIDIGRIRQPVDISYYEVSSRALACLVVTIKLALILHLVVEQPFKALRKLYWQDRPEEKLAENMTADCDLWNISLEKPDAEVEVPAYSDGVDSTENTKL